MKQYLLSVAMIDDAPPRPPAETQRAYEQVSRLNEELQTAGAWVFAGGLLPASSATVVRAQGSEVLVTDGPFTESKEHIGGVWIIEAADLDAALAWAAKATRACGEPCRSPALSGQSRRLRPERPMQEGLTAASSECSARRSGVPSRSWSGHSVTSTWPRRVCRRPSPSQRSAGPSTACPPARPAGSSRRHGAGSSIACGERPRGTTARRRPRSSTNVTVPTRTSRCTTTGSA